MCFNGCRYYQHKKWLLHEHKRNQTMPRDENVTETGNKRNEHLFFDLFLHPSEATHFIFTRRCLKELPICFPINLVELLKA